MTNRELKPHAFALSSRSVSTRTAAELKSEVEHDNRRATRPTQPVHARRRSGKELTAPDKFYLPVDATPQSGGALRSLHSSANARSFSKPGELLRAGSDRLNRAASPVNDQSRRSLLKTSLHDYKRELLKALENGSSFFAHELETSNTNKSLSATTKTEKTAEATLKQTQQLKSKQKQRVINQKTNSASPNVDKQQLRMTVSEPISLSAEGVRDSIEREMRRASTGKTDAERRRNEALLAISEPSVDCMRDMYGNPVPEHLEESFAAWHEQYVLRAPERNQAVSVLLGDTFGQQDLRRISALMSDPEQCVRVVRTHAERGVSPNWRGRVWSVMLDLDARAVTADGRIYESLCESLADGSVRTAFDEQIARDVPRTFPDVVTFHPTYLERLSKLLRMYSHYSTFGYTQGMNFLASGLLLFFDDKEAFLAMRWVAEELLPFYFSDGMIGLRADTIVFELCLQRCVPVLWSHFKKINFSTILLTCQWFCTLFVKSFPHETAFRMWDLIFMDGGVAVMLEFGVRVLALFEVQLLEINDDIDLLCSLNEWCESLFDAEQLLALPIMDSMMDKSDILLTRVRVRRVLIREAHRNKNKK